MKYELPNKSAGYFPEVLALLRGLNDSQIHGHERSLSHPADIFLLTFSDVVECIGRLSKSVNSASEHVMLGGTMDDTRLGEMRHQIFDLLFYSGNFIEGCSSIIKSLFQEGDKKAAKASREFRNNVEGYISHASQIINKVKHQHRRQRVFTFNWDRKIIVGYYLEGIIDRGVLGPDPELHKIYQSMYTGFSLNREIPYQLVNIYYASACLANIVRTYTKSATVEEKIIDSEKLRSALDEAAKVPCLLLPDEFDKQLPTIVRKDDDRFILECPGKREILNREPHGAEVRLDTRIGVYDRGIALPYIIKTEQQ